MKGRGQKGTIKGFGEHGLNSTHRSWTHRPPRIDLVVMALERKRDVWAAGCLGWNAHQLLTFLYYIQDDSHLPSGVQCGYRWRARAMVTLHSSCWGPRELQILISLETCFSNFEGRVYCDSISVSKQTIIHVNVKLLLSPC